MLMKQNVNNVVTKDSPIPLTKILVKVAKFHRYSVLLKLLVRKFLKVEISMGTFHTPPPPPGRIGLRGVKNTKV